MKLTDEQNAAFLRHVVDEQYCYIDDYGNGQFVIDGVLDLGKALEAVFAKMEPRAWIAEGQGWGRVFIDKEAAEKLAAQGGTLTPLYGETKPLPVAVPFSKPATVHECAAYAFPVAKREAE